MSVPVHRLHQLRRAKALRSLFCDNTTPKSVVIDYSSPNIAKQFHIGNLRSTLIGRFIDQVQRMVGANVTSVNYVGDWGTQFAMIAAYWPQMKPSDQYWNSLGDLQKIKALMDCYVVANRKFKSDEDFRLLVHEVFAKMEKSLSSDEICEEMKLWEDIRKISKAHLNIFYRMFSVSFDSFIVLKNKKPQIAYEDNQRRCRIDLGDKNYFVIRKSNATSLYLTREVASIFHRDKIFKADRYLYVVDRSQQQHFDSLKEVITRLGKSDLAAKIEHIAYGRVHGLSTRQGKTEAVGEIVERGAELAKEFMKSSRTFSVPEGEEDQVANELSLSAIVYNELKRARKSEYEFSFRNSFSLNQNNALFLQIKHSRLCSIEKQNKEILPHLESCQSFPTSDCDENVEKLVDLISTIDKAILDAAEKLEPCQLTMHLTQLARAAGTVAAKLKVKDQPNEVAVPRLLLLSASRNVLTEGITLLGMKPLRNM
ncbi:unnamed protein product [Caenorhabditis auriculariae]|uniref:Probable arginine--tRNA ligase, mitochondrial n=1 Tax=Caenorhabditis auriculariae TaxID=2777116 RepID=A0A8S1HJQ9_9PELO|nr:unnamed protein product [Caenorhabditis auriculariae]